MLELACQVKNKINNVCVEREIQYLHLQDIEVRIKTHRVIVRLLPACVLDLLAEVTVSMLQVVWVDGVSTLQRRHDLGENLAEVYTRSFATLPCIF